jgi:hypothetical protein
MVIYDKQKFNSAYNCYLLAGRVASALMRQEHAAMLQAMRDNGDGTHTIDDAVVYAVKRQTGHVPSGGRHVWKARQDFLRCMKLATQPKEANNG